MTINLVEEEFRVSEIGAVDVAPDVPMSNERVNRIKAQDTDPMFLVIEIEEGMSKSKRQWPGSVLRSISEQVNEKLPVGYRGHIKDEDDPFVFPEPQIAWLGAAVSERSGKTVVRAKGYVLNSEAKRLIGLGVLNEFSVRGNASQTPLVGGGLEVKTFDLESIDFARPNRGGMKTKIISITSEMEGGNQVDGKDIAALTEEELRAHNPLLVNKIETDAKGNLETKVAEQETALKGAEDKDTLLQSIRQKLGLDESADVLENLTAIMDRVEGAVRTEVRTFIKEKVADKVKNERGQQLVLRMVGEMQDVTPAVDDTGKLTDATKKAIEDKLNDTFENDEDVKAIVSEQIVTVSSGGSNLGGRARSATSHEGGNRNVKIEEVPYSG